jgi:hypothetical protein
MERERGKRKGGEKEYVKGEKDKERKVKQKTEGREGKREGEKEDLKKGREEKNGR